MHFPWSWEDKSQQEGFFFLPKSMKTKIPLHRNNPTLHVRGGSYNPWLQISTLLKMFLRPSCLNCCALPVHLNNQSRPPFLLLLYVTDIQWVAFLSSAETCYHCLLPCSPTLPLKEKWWVPSLWIQMRRLMTDCLLVPIPKQHPNIYLHKRTAPLGPVCVSLHWPPWFVSSIVSQCSFSAGVAAETMRSFSANNGSEVFPVISIEQVYLLLWNRDSVNTA